MIKALLTLFIFIISISMIFDVVCYFINYFYKSSKIKVGDSYEKILKEHGTPNDSYKSEAADFEILIYRLFLGFKLIFTLKDGKVIHISKYS